MCVIVDHDGGKIETPFYTIDSPVSFVKCCPTFAFCSIKTFPTQYSSLSKHKGAGPNTPMNDWCQTKAIVDREENYMMHNKRPHSPLSSWNCTRGTTTCQTGEIIITQLPS
jgi:hypothetical protein